MKKVVKVYYVERARRDAHGSVGPLNWEHYSNCPTEKAAITTAMWRANMAGNGYIWRVGVKTTTTRTVTRTTHKILFG